MWFFGGRMFWMFGSTNNVAMDSIHGISLCTFLSISGHMPKKGIITGEYFFNSTGSCPINSCPKRLYQFIYLLSICKFSFLYYIHSWCHQIFHFCQFVDSVGLTEHFPDFSVWLSILRYLYKPPVSLVNAKSVHVILNFMVDFFKPIGIIR